MNQSNSRRLFLALAFATLSMVGARAGTVTGNPAADGWNLNGNSLSKGTYVYSNWPNDPARYPVENQYLFNYNVYSTSFNLESGSALIDGNGWNAGDLILGIGATGLQSAALDGQVRFLAKFGTDTATFKASSFAPADPIPTDRTVANGWSTANLYGDGAGRSGDAGTGGIIVETPQIWGGQNPWFNATNADKIISIDGTSSTNNNDPGAGALRQAHTDRIGGGGRLDNLNLSKIIYNLDANSGYLSNFETYLNISLLERSGFSVNPGVGDNFVLAVQRLDNYFTKATGTFETSAVPEPSSVVMVALGLGGLGLAALRRRGRSAV